MRTLPSHIATTVLIAICEGKVHLIFSWSSNGTHIAPLENNDIHVYRYTEKRKDGWTEAGEIPLRKVLLRPPALMIREQYMQRYHTYPLHTATRGAL